MTNSNNKSIVFVYNADSGFFNSLADSAHKFFSPHTYNCNLCSITHKSFGAKKEWKEFVNNFCMPLTFLHRDEFKKKYRTPDIFFPAIFELQDGQINLVVDATSINSIKTVSELIDIINSKVVEFEK